MDGSIHHVVRARVLRLVETRLLPVRPRDLHLESSAVPFLSWPFEFQRTVALQIKHSQLVLDELHFRVSTPHIIQSPSHCDVEACFGQSLSRFASKVDPTRLPKPHLVSRAHSSLESALQHVLFSVKLKHRLQLVSLTLLDVLLNGFLFVVVLDCNVHKLFS